VERLAGSDAILWHLENNTAMHTLKVLVVDPSRRGAPLTLTDVHKAIEANIDRYPRARQRVVAPLVRFHGRPYWVETRDALDVRRHLDERQAVAPGGWRQFDAVLADLAERRLPLDRPLWHVTLLHGLEHGRQALICQVHHAITDGSAAAAAFEGLTTAEPGGEPDMPTIPPPPPTERSLLRTATRQVPRWMAAGPQVIRAAAESNRRAAAFRDVAQHLPPAGLSQSRDTFLIKGSFGSRRVCATASLPLADFQKVSRSAGVTLNGALHGVLAGALRAERLRRGEDVSQPLAAAFGIALDEPDAPPRSWGNNVTPTYVLLHSNVADPTERLRLTAASAKEGVELRRAAGHDAITHVGHYTPRLPSAFLRTLKDIVPTPAHIVTANVRGPAKHRWLGDCEVVDWYSFAIITPPIPVNLTVYSYAGELKFGLLSEPDTFDDPYPFLDEVEMALAELVALTV
jgi:WS/DGAT/MGAT family acyltransferase